MKPTYTQTDFDEFDYKGKELSAVFYRKSHCNSLQITWSRRILTLTTLVVREKPYWKSEKSSRNFSLMMKF